MNNLDRIIGKFNMDENGNPNNVHILRKHQISPIYNGFQLDQIPNDRYGVNVVTPEGMHEVYSADEVSENTYYVKNDGVVLFDKSMAGKEVVIDYYGRGLELIGASRVYTMLDSKGNVIETLGDIFDVGRIVIDAIKTVGDVIVVLEKISDDVEEANRIQPILHEDIRVATPLEASLAQNVNRGEPLLESLEPVVTEGTRLDTDLPPKVDEGIRVEQELEDAITRGDIPTMKSDIVELGSQLSENTNVVDCLENFKENQFKKNFYMNRNTYGTYDNACVGGFIANSKDRPAVLGISPENDIRLATYENRDSVGLYVSNSTNDNNIFEFQTAVYTVDTIELPILFDTSKIKNGMIIDTKHNPKFSAIIKEINGNILGVYNWYEKENTIKGQVPPSGIGGYINNTTKIWGQNLNIFLQAKDKLCAGTAVETGVFNYQEHRDFADGYDTVTMGNQNCNVAYRARSSNNTLWKKGFEALNCEVGFYSNRPNTGGWIVNPRDYGYNVENAPISYISKGDGVDKAFLSQDRASKVNFHIRNDGRMAFQSLDTQIVDTNKKVTPILGSLVFLKSSCSLEGALNHPGRTLIFHNVSGNSLAITGLVQCGTVVKTGLFLQNAKTVNLISDGNYWHILDFSDSFSLPQ